MMMEQRSEQWFSARKGRVTASAVGAILGVDPNADRKTIMRRMVRQYHKAPSEWNGNIATQWGITHEDEAREDLEAKIGLPVTSATFVVHPAMDWLGASPDGYVGDDYLVEIKCPFGLRDKEAPVPFKNIEDQEHYYAQMQVQMFCTNRSQCYFWQWTPRDNKLDIVSYDPEYIAKIVPKLREFYMEFLAACDEPDEYLNDPLVIVDTPRALQMVAEYTDVLDAIAKAEERKKELLEAMVEMAKGRNASFGGKRLTKTERAGSVSYAKAIQVLAPGANLEPWRGKPTSFWTLK
jgi:putative phage-type endonuclease